MPKKASTTPAKQRQTKTIPIVTEAETDTNWGKLTKSATPRKKAGTTAMAAAAPSSIKYSNDPDKFPHYGFPIRLEYKDGNDKKTCWFQCYDHYHKHVTRYKVTDYVATTNDMALVG